MISMMKNKRKNDSTSHNYFKIIKLILKIFENVIFNTAAKKIRLNPIK